MSSKVKQLRQCWYVGCWYGTEIIACDIIHGRFASTTCLHITVLEGNIDVSFDTRTGV
jgi:hypothetical protein